MKRIAGALMMILLACGASLVRAQDLSRPMLLVAKPGLHGPYTHTALLVVPVGDKHMGFILNRATDTHLGKAFPDHAPSQKVLEPIFFGGPEAADALFAVVRRNPGEPSMRLFGDLYMTANSKNIDRIIEQTPNDARYFAGFVGWMPQELAKEIAAGFWFVGEADVAQVFRKDIAGMWDELVGRLGKGKAKRPGEQEAQWGTWLASVR